MAQATAELALLAPEDDLYGFVVERLAELQPGAIVIASEWVSDDLVRLKALTGFGDLLPRGVELLGGDLVGMSIWECLPAS